MRVFIIFFFFDNIYFLEHVHIHCCQVELFKKIRISLKICNNIVFPFQTFTKVGLSFSVIQKKGVESF